MHRRYVLAALVLACSLSGLRRSRADAPPPAPPPGGYDCEPGCYKSYCQPPPEGNCAATVGGWDCFCPNRQSCAVAAPGL